MVLPDTPSPAVDLAVIKPEPLPAEDELAMREKRKYRSARLKLKLKDLRREIDNRQKYTGRLYGLMIGWMIVVLLILILSGIHDPNQSLPLVSTGRLSSPPTSRAGFLEWLVAFKLSDPVLLALIGGTSANVIGLFLVVANYLFPKRNKTLD